MVLHILGLLRMSMFEQSDAPAVRVKLSAQTFTHIFFAVARRPASSCVGRCAQCRVPPSLVTVSHGCIRLLAMYAVICSYNSEYSHVVQRVLHHAVLHFSWNVRQAENNSEPSCWFSGLRTRCSVRRGSWRSILGHKIQCLEIQAKCEIADGKPHSLQRHILCKPWAPMITILGCCIADAFL